MFGMACAFPIVQSPEEQAAHPQKARLEPGFAAIAETGIVRQVLVRTSFSNQLVNTLWGLLMVAFNRIRCQVVSVGSDSHVSRGALARDVLPWADPYVAQLIKKLQDEVRYERRLRSVLRKSALVSVRSMPE
jgi:hypothetical protein